MATVAEACAAVAVHTNTPLGHLKHVTRRLQEANLLPLAIGTNVPSIRIEHLASLLLGLLSDAKLKNVADAVEIYGGLVLNGFDLTVMPADIRPNIHTSRDYIERVLHIFATGSTEQRAVEARLTIEVVSTWPELTIHDPTDRSTIRLVAPGADATRWQSEKARRAISVSGRALERITAALSLTR